MTFLMTSKEPTMLGRLVKLAVAALAVTLAVRAIPDLRRYVRMMRM